MGCLDPLTSFSLIADFPFGRFVVFRGVLQGCRGRQTAGVERAKDYTEGGQNSTIKIMLQIRLNEPARFPKLLGVKYRYPGSGLSPPLHHGPENKDKPGYFFWKHPGGRSNKSPLTFPGKTCALVHATTALISDRSQMAVSINWGSFCGYQCSRRSTMFGSTLGTPDVSKLPNRIPKGEHEARPLDSRAVTRREPQRGTPREFEHKDPGRYVPMTFLTSS